MGSVVERISFPPVGTPVGTLTGVEVGVEVGVAVGVDVEEVTLPRSRGRVMRNNARTVQRALTGEQQRSLQEAEEHVEERVGGRIFQLPQLSWSLFSVGRAR